jgi:tRNA threonylcarbamoyladenosine biosynthesis protein TsaB
MNLLAFDTSTTRCVSALVRADGALFAADEAAGNTHSQLLLPQVERLLRGASLDFADLDVIAYGAGPGSFTGVRIACACAQGLAFAHGKPLVPVGTLEALVCTYGASVRGDAQRKSEVWVINDARMNELYVARYVLAGDVWREDVAPQVRPLAFLDTLDLSHCALAGDAAHAIATLAHLRAQATVAYLSGHGLIDAALAAHADGRAQHPREAQPLYVRNKVALTEAERAAA